MSSKKAAEVLTHRGLKTLDFLAQPDFLSDLAAFFLGCSEFFQLSGEARNLARSGVVMNHAL